MVYASLAFVVIFVLFASGLLLVFYREKLHARLSAVLTEQGRRDPNALLNQNGPTGQIRSAVNWLDKLLPKTTSEVKTLQKRLTLAGYRDTHHATILNSCKVAMPIVLALAVWLTGIYQSNPIIFFLLAVLLGYLGPDYWLSYRIRARQNEIRLALPNVLDLLVVCLEAGLSMDQAVLRTSEEMHDVHPDLADELSLVMVDMRGGRSRGDAWKGLATRTEVDTVRMLVTILLQADQFGTGISRTLRTHAETLRTRRKQRVEELAAKTTVKLVFPLVLFIFPSLFIVTIGPAAIQIMNGFAALQK